MTQEAIDHIKVKYVKLVRATLDRDDGVEAIALHVQLLEQRIAEYEEFYIHRNEAQCIQDKNTGEMLKYIAKLSTPKTCEGCIYNDEEHTASHCGSCIRSEPLHDYYEPKDNG